MTDINWSRPKAKEHQVEGNDFWVRMDELYLFCSESAAVGQVCMLPSDTGADDLHLVCMKQKLSLVIVSKLHIESVSVVTA